MQQIVHAEEHLDTTPSSRPRVRIFGLARFLTLALTTRPSQESGKAEAELEGEKLKAKPEIVKKIADDWDEEDEEEQEKRRAEEGGGQTSGRFPSNE